MLFADAFRAMDTDIDVEIAADERPHAAFVSVRLLFEQQEQRFSRFRESSLLYPRMFRASWWIRKSK